MLLTHMCAKMFGHSYYFTQQTAGGGAVAVTANILLVSIFYLLISLIN